MKWKIMFYSGIALSIISGLLAGFNMMSGQEPALLASIGIMFTGLGYAKMRSRR